MHTVEKQIYQNQIDKLKRIVVGEGEWVGVGMEGWVEGWVMMWVVWVMVWVL